jgi:alpha-soluble NSF attachment protein
MAEGRYDGKNIIRQAFAVLGSVEEVLSGANVFHSKILSNQAQDYKRETGVFARRILRGSNDHPSFLSEILGVFASMSVRGDEFFKMVEKKLTAFFPFTKSGKYTDAGNLFSKAGNAYKSVGDFAKAGEAYYRAADCYLQLNDLMDAAQSATDAGKMFAKLPEKAPRAIEAFRMAVRIYRENSRPTQAARLLAESAKIFQDSGDLNSAITALEDAAQLFDDEGQPMQAVNQIAAIADIKSGQENWLEAARAYRDVAERRMKDRLTQMAAGEFLTKAALCLMAADDAVGAETMVSAFVAISPG